MKRGPKPISVKKRFDSKYTPIPESGCWLWDAYILPVGYGMININNRPQYAHRVSWELYNGEIPKGKFVLHKCDIRSCVNPEHLFLGTPLDNMQDMIRKGRDLKSRGENHCRAKITAETAALIKKSKDRNMIIAKTYNVSRSCVSSIKTNRTWRHI